MKTTQTSYTSTLSSRHRTRKFLFIFSQSDNWWLKTLGGYTHVSLMEQIDDETYIYIDPMTYGSETSIIKLSSPFPIIDGLTILKVTIKSNKRVNKLVRLGFQSCSTIVQYMAGIWLGAWTAHGLYRSLTELNLASLHKHGIIEVVKHG